MPILNQTDFERSITYLTESHLSYWEHTWMMSWFSNHGYSSSVFLRPDMGNLKCKSSSLVVLLAEGWKAKISPGYCCCHIYLPETLLSGRLRCTQLSNRVHLDSDEILIRVEVTEWMDRTVLGMHIWTVATNAKPSMCFRGISSFHQYARHTTICENSE